LYQSDKAHSNNQKEAFELGCSRRCL